MKQLMKQENLNILLISTCSTSRQSGVLIVTLPMQEMLAFMRIIGKISEGNHMLRTMKENNASNGRRKILFKLMQTAAEMNIDVAFHMDGRNKNIIH
jgi:hypothetical protein